MRQPLCVAGVHVRSGLFHLMNRFTFGVGVVQPVGGGGGGGGGFWPPFTTIVKPRVTVCWVLLMLTVTFLFPFVA